MRIFNRTFNIWYRESTNEYITEKNVYDKNGLFIKSVRYTSNNWLKLLLLILLKYYYHNGDNL